MIKKLFFKIEGFLKCLLRRSNNSCDVLTFISDQKNLFNFRAFQICIFYWRWVNIFTISINQHILYTVCYLKVSPIKTADITGMKPTIFIDHISCFLRLIPISFHYTMTSHNYLAFRTFKVLIKRIVGLNTDHFFSLNILNGNFYPRYDPSYRTINLAMIFCNRHHRRSFRQTEALKNFNSEIPKEFTYIFRKSSSPGNHKFQPSARFFFYLTEHKLFCELLLDT